jgi:excisionase family DNA binding protein
MSNPFEELTVKIDRVISILEQSAPAPSGVIQIPDKERPMSTEEACKYLGITRQTLNHWRRKGIVTSNRMGGKLFFKRSELDLAMKVPVC